MKNISVHILSTVGKFTAAWNMRRLVAVPGVFHVNTFAVCNDVPTITCASDKALHRSNKLIPVSVFGPSSVFTILCHRDLALTGSFVSGQWRQWSSIRDVDVLYATARNTPFVKYLSQFTFSKQCKEIYCCSEIRTQRNHHLAKHP